MTRKTVGWEGRLTDYLHIVARVMFRPGKIDCGLFFGGGFAAMTGDNTHVKLFANKYRSINGAMSMLKEMGYDNHVEYVAAHLEELPSPLFATRGDCAVYESEEGGFALGIVQGENVYVMTLQGLGLRRLQDAVRAFRV